jgi:hypothetical protein
MNFAMFYVDIIDKDDEIVCSYSNLSWKAIKDFVYDFKAYNGNPAITVYCYDRQGSIIIPLFNNQIW